MDKAPYINVSKLDVAKRQLETAITLFLTNSDPISIHALSAAANEVLGKLIKKQNLTPSIITEGIEKFIKPEKKQEFFKKIKEAPNFFKHADKDADEIYKFHFKTSEYLLFDACIMYEILTKEKTPLVFVFYIWFYSAHSNILLNKGTETLYNLGLNPENRLEFLNLLPDIIKLKNKTNNF